MAGSGLVTQIRKGALEYCVLALLEHQVRYGFELVQELARVDGMLTSEGTIYPLLSRLRKEHLVETEWRESLTGPPRRYYRLTADGERALASFRMEWTIFRNGVDTILNGDTGT